MGLAGPSVKRKLTDDPRNERWAQDQSRFGFKLLKSMGWKPESTALDATLPAPPPRKTLSSIPTAKDDLLGLGATRQTTASSIFAAFGSRGLRFVTAGSSKAEDDRHKTEGGDFASLLSRLNASVSASASASPAPEAPPRKKKRRKEIEAEAAPVPHAPLFRNSSRARHLAAKRMASSSAADLAGILGYELPVVKVATLPTASPILDIAADPVAGAAADDADDATAKAARKAERKRRKVEALSAGSPAEADRAARRAARKAKRNAEKATPRDATVPL